MNLSSYSPTSKHLSPSPMCDRIYNRDTNQEIETVGDLCALVGRALVETHEGTPDPDTCCLCNTDHFSILLAAGYKWEPNGGDTTDITIYKPAHV